MRHSVVNILFAFFTALVLAGCGSHRTISDETFVEMFREMYLANTYCSNYDVKCDSLDIYTPIINKYGATTEEFVAKLTSFSKRKSARLSSVISAAIKEMEDESAKYKRLLEFDREISDEVILRATDSLFADTLIVVERKADSLLLKKTYAAKEGTYKLDMNYEIEDRKEEQAYFASITVRDKFTGERVSNSRYILMSGHESRINMSVNVALADRHREVCVRMVNLAGVDRMPRITVKNVSIRYIPTIEVARKIVFEERFAYKPYMAAVEDYSAIEWCSPSLESGRMLLRSADTYARRSEADTAENHVER